MERQNFNKYTSQQNNALENSDATGEMDYPLIDNNNEKNIGIQQITDESEKDKVFIKKDLLKSINSFVACIGPPGAGKSTFCSNYYKILYKVKNDYFESSESSLVFTKGIWIVSEAEKRKIPVDIKREPIDVEGFRVDDSKTWKYVMIIAFLSTKIIILNRNSRADDTKKILRIIANSLKRMKKQKMPKILKKIYIQMTSEKLMKKYTVEQFLELLNYDKDAFKGITFEYIYLPSIRSEYENELDDPEYQKYFKDILKILNKTKYYNSVSSLIDFIDEFNVALNDNMEFNSQAILKDITFDFEGVYSKNENKLKNILSKKIETLKPLESINETFEQFIKKQEGLEFTFTVQNEDLTFYGSCDDFNNFYEELKKKKTFRIKPEDIFLDVYNTQKSKLEIKELKRRQEEESQKLNEELKRKKEEKEGKNQEEKKRKIEENLKVSKEQEKILNYFNEKKKEISNYFATLRFMEDFSSFKFSLELDINQVDFAKKKLEELKEYYNCKMKEKKDEWNMQIERAKWKVPVEVYGENICKNCHNIIDDASCPECNGQLFWVDSEENYVICKGCKENNLRKIGKIICKKCGVEGSSKPKWIKGYKP